MRSFNALAALSWGLLTARQAAAQSDPLAGVNLNPDELESYDSNALFNRWRPRFHFMAPAGHMNDPCAPMYNNFTDTYHLFYQHHPNHVEVGNTSWGHATSKDLITWVDVGGWQNNEPDALQPDPYPGSDWLGVFSGDGQPVNLRGEADGNMTIFYTCVEKEPIGWGSNETAGSETQCLATSSDAGQTWQKYEGNPILRNPPEGWNFTGWRDPYVHTMPEVDAILGYTEPHWYMVLGSGIYGAGSRIPLYTAEANDLTNWTFLGSIIEPPQNFSWGDDAFRTASAGFNFELAGFNALVEKEENGGDGTTVHFVANAGSEGGNNTYHPFNHWSVFFLGGGSKRSDGSFELDLRASGAVDWGNLYASTTFNDTKNDRRVLWGWSDEDMGDYAVIQQGFQGSLGLPREVFIQKSHGVLAPAGGALKGPAIWDAQDDGTFTVTDLASKPLPDVIEALHLDQGVQFGNVSVSNKTSAINVTSDHFHLKASVSDWDGPFGFIVRASPGLEEYTQIVYYPANSTLALQRSHSSLVQNFTQTDYQAFFEPYTFAQGGKDVTEAIEFDIFVDGSLIEIFINNRFSLTSRIYPTRADALNVALLSQGTATFGSVQAWSNMLNVWPERPSNSSSPLYQDPWYETHMSFDNVFGIPIGLNLYPGF
ncbi:glycoside hydrolase family 32 protein [Xylona heveae TC161]|uniref:Glycoside hydrolase family 32 protein n=1 Tax=Xylona heveae (strain CBS 132557 / TC161) TaxID=1328760 RepID=A0A165HD74_XYLHT|nr:glycoside hydrolase family 32 protein [Xylona heveae TC161]KZF23331.1 glycoside hydrolase family 32 protein [Xylona heveae TC161]